MLRNVERTMSGNANKKVKKADYYSEWSRKTNSENILKFHIISFRPVRFREKSSECLREVLYM